MRQHIACCITRDTNTHLEYVIILPFHCNNGCMNAPQYYVTRTSPVVFDAALKSANKRNWHESGGKSFTYVEAWLNPTFGLLRT
jgi:hypothetical protein